MGRGSSVKGPLPRPVSPSEKNEVPEYIKRDPRIARPGKKFYCKHCGWIGERGPLHVDQKCAYVATLLSEDGIKELTE